jgi:hypothetical protein
MAKRKLAEADVLRVLELREEGRTQAEIAKMFNVSTPNISFILTGRTWSHVTGIVFQPRSRKKVESPEPKPQPEPEPVPEPLQVRQGDDDREHLERPVHGVRPVEVQLRLPDSREEASRCATDPRTGLLRGGAP